jgi:hypothetical protein
MHPTCLGVGKPAGNGLIEVRVSAVAFEPPTQCFADQARIDG